MTSRNKAIQTGSVTGRLLNLPATIISLLTWRICRVNRCKIEGQNLIFHKGLFTSRIVQASEIENWSFCPEMGFDIVSIQLTSGEVLTWIDKHNDLLGSLRTLAKAKETPPDEVS